ncbi:serine/threonine protein kinase, partial [Streptomyces albidoflavus]
MMPPVPPGQNPDDPHPWQNQLRAARDRNEQTQVQYLDPGEDPLRRRPQRRPAPGQGQGQQQGGYDNRGHQQAPPPQPYPNQQQYAAPPQHQPQRYAPPPPPQPQPQRYEPQPPPRAERPPREPREPRRRS